MGVQSVRIDKAAAVRAKVVATAAVASVRAAAGGLGAAALGDEMVGWRA